MFDFHIKNRTGLPNQVDNELSHHPKSNDDNSSVAESVEYEAISYATVCIELNDVIKGLKLPTDVKQEIHNKSMQDQQFPT